MLYSKETRLVRREVYNFVTAFNRIISKTKVKAVRRTMLSGRPKNSNN